MTDIRVTHIGGPTVLLEIGGWRLLTDPTFDPPGRRYAFGWGTASRKTVGPAIPAAEIGPLDGVLLTHDQHADNLDDAGRDLLPAVGTVLTTGSGARRLGGNAVGLEPWQATTLSAAGRPDLDVTATPCRHGPAGSRPIVGNAIGFALRWNGQEHGSLWITGDTVLYEGVRQVAARLPVGTVLLHLGGVRFPITGPIRYTMPARDGVALCALIGPHSVIPVHYEGWSHFQQDRAVIEAAFSGAPPAVRGAVRWAEPGSPLTVTV